MAKNKTEIHVTTVFDGERFGHDECADRLAAAGQFGEPGDVDRLLLGQSRR